MSASNIQVAIKVRPIEPNQTCKWEVAGNSIKLVDGGGPEPFYFDHIFDQDASNQVIFDKIAKQIVASGVKGFNGTIFAYGQTSSGKTYTMMGDEQNPGVMVLAAKKIFREIEHSTDWQFLLRVSYIEIYNEKIHDLLNKSNTDLKIHETPNGEVAVNCSENIITCEQDLLIHLREGSKQRRIGETNMNDRSSRSHAIFRIIIESRKIDQTDEDSVQISILNLVDLAGSERADQTGATGSRLKEGSHINKSLLFLSRVIKQLAEAKYVSYRDSKLTRILQASLGGNALTAIICTINPTAIEETLSTLSFANRAKVVKNKPQVNEVVSDSAMMKRLVKKIDALTTELEVEKTKNSQIKVSQLQKLLNDEIHKIINSSTSGSLKASSKNRRRTWCPSSMIPTLPEETSAKTETNIPPMPFTAQIPTKLQLPKSAFNFTPHITVRDVYYQEKLKEIESSPSIDEEFIPGEDVCFDEALTPQTSPMKLGFKTPTNSDFKLRTSLTPKLTEKQSLLKVEQELKELETFTNLENKLNVEHDAFDTLKYKLENAERIIAGFEKERESFAFMKVEHLEAQTNLENCQKRCQELESKVKDLEESSARSLDRTNRYEKEVSDLKEKINKLEMENRAAVGLEFEFEQHRNKSKRRETELLEALEEKRKEINKLERSLQTVTNEMLNNSKEEIQQISRSLNEADSTCTKCKDFQRILSGKQQLIEDFEKVNLDNQTLHSNIAKISAEAESAKLKADYLETENTSLKKDIENLSSLHGTVEIIQEQISSLQLEKCKLETVKIEFEVMSKETANKIAEKINISQEIQNLNTQRDNLAAECDKLQTEINLTICTREELEKIRSENNSLNSELQEIKTKLETTQQNYFKLMDENQSKSDSFEKLNMEVVSARNQLQTLQSEYQDIQRKYEQIQAECNKHEGTIGDIQTEYESIQNKYQCLQKEYEKLENDSVQSFADCDRVQTQNENLETEIHELKIKVEEAQRKLLENESLQLELESLKTEMNRLQGEYQQNLSASIDIGKQEGSELRAENTKLKEDLSSLQLRFDEMQKEYEDISTELVDNFSDYETLQKEMANLQAEFDRYKSTAVVESSPDTIESMKIKTQKLEADNKELVKENIELKNTVTSLTKSEGEKCDESENISTQLQEGKNDSVRSKSPMKDNIQFVQLAESILEIEITLGNGGAKFFKAVGFNKYSNGTRLIIGNISDITQGTFDELRGAIDFVISNDVHKLSNEIFDSLEMEKHTATPNSCDSLEELAEEKSKLFESVRDLQETVAVLRSETVELANTRKELEDAQLVVEQLKSEKSKLCTICEENKHKISELSEIISRAESENMKLIVDCEELKKTVEFEGPLESVSRESYEELKRLYDEMNRKMLESNNCVAEQCATCTELREQILVLQAMSVKGVIDSHSSVDNLNKNGLNDEPMCTSCEEYLSKISKLEAFVSERFSNEQQTNGIYNENSPKSIKQQIIECNERNGGLELSSSQGASDADNETAKYEEKISTLREELENEKYKNQEIQSQITDLQTKFEAQNLESAGQIKDLNTRFTKLQTEYDELLSFERMKSTELEESALRLEMLGKDCSHLQESVAGLKKTVTVLEEERNNILKEKKDLKKNNNDLNEEVNYLKKDNEIILNEKNIVLAKTLVLEEQKEKIMAECHELQANIQKLTEDHKTNKESEEQLEKLNEDLQRNAKEKEMLEEKLDKLSGELATISADKQQLQSELEKLKEEQEILKECHLKERENLQVKITSLNSKIEELMNEKEELKTAFEKAKNQSEFLLQQGKIMEDELSLEMSAVRNSNCAMKREMEELKDKLQTTENNLTAALEKINSEKDQLKVELTNSKTSLLEKITDLENECTLLKEELTSSKQSLLNEVSQKQALENECKIKEDLLAQSSDSKDTLETKCLELERKCEVLEQQVEETKQTLSSDMQQLEISKKESLQKDEVISDLSNKNLTLATQSTQLEEKIATLEQEIEASKRDFSDNIRLNNNESSKKDDLISELSTKNSSLATKSSELENKLLLLEKQFEETKLSLATEIHLKEVLEKANTERDDLIVQLTNNNNSLVTKSTELEEKLAILGNQFEESKRHLSAEVSRLNKSLAEANAASTSQSSKIDDLMQKIKCFESELQKTALERDTLLQKIDVFQEEYDSLALKHAKLELTTSSFEAELNSAREVVVENTTLIKKSNELQNSLKELQLKCDSLKSSNAEFEEANKILSKKLNDAVQQAEECNRLRSEIVKLQQEIKKEQNLKNKLNDDLQQEIKKEQNLKNKLNEDLKTQSKDWESKELLFSQQIVQLQANIASLNLEKNRIQKDFEDAVKSNSDKITQLEQQLHSLQKDTSMNISKTSISPRKEKGMEHWMTENHQLKIKNMSLMDKLDSCQKSSPNEERKNRRLSTHDERRMQSFWDSNRDVSTMTDPTNAECSCSEMNLKLNELKQKLLIRDSQVNTLSMELKNHPLKTENAMLKKLFAEEESKQQHLRQEIKKYKNVIVNRTNESRHCAKCAELSKKIFVDSFSQTTDCDESECYRKLLGKYEDLKVICRFRHTKIRELEDAISKGKENANDNISSLHNQQYRQKYEQIKKELNIVQEKYEEAKLLCNKRYEQLNKLSNQQSGNS